MTSCVTRRSSARLHLCCWSWIFLACLAQSGGSTFVNREDLTEEHLLPVRIARAVAADSGIEGSGDSIPITPLRNGMMERMILKSGNDESRTEMRDEARSRETVEDGDEGSGFDEESPRTAELALAKEEEIATSATTEKPTEIGLNASTAREKTLDGTTREEESEEEEEREDDGEISDESKEEHAATEASTLAYIEDEPKAKTAGEGVAVPIGDSGNERTEEAPVEEIVVGAKRIEPSFAVNLPTTTVEPEAKATAESTIAPETKTESEAEAPQTTAASVPDVPEIAKTAAGSTIAPETTTAEISTSPEEPEAVAASVHEVPETANAAAESPTAETSTPPEEPETTAASLPEAPEPAKTFAESTAAETSTPPEEPETTAASVHEIPEIAKTVSESTTAETSTPPEAPEITAASLPEAPEPAKTSAESTIAPETTTASEVPAESTGESVAEVHEAKTIAESAAANVPASPDAKETAEEAVTFPDDDGTRENENLTVGMDASRMNLNSRLLDSEETVVMETKDSSRLGAYIVISLILLSFLSLTGFILMKRRKQRRRKEANLDQENLDTEKALLSLSEYKDHPDGMDEGKIKNNEITPIVIKSNSQINKFEKNTNFSSPKNINTKANEKNVEKDNVLRKTSENLTQVIIEDPSKDVEEEKSAANAEKLIVRTHLDQDSIPKKPVIVNRTSLGCVPVSQD